MQRVFKRPLAAAMAIIMVVTLLIACSNNNNTSAPSTNSNNGASTGNSLNSTEAVSNAGNENGKLFAEPMTLTVMKDEHPSQPFVLDSPVIQEIYNRTNVKIELMPVPGSDYSQVSRTRIASNNMPDILFTTFATMSEFADSGIFLNISDYMNHAPNMQELLINEPEFYKVTFNNQFYGFPAKRPFNLWNGPVAMMRVDKVEELGLNIPTTFEELYEVLKAFKQAWPDTYPITFRNGVNYFLPYMAFSFGSGANIYFDPHVDGGKYVFGPAYEDDFTPVLEYLNRLYSEGILDPDYAVNTNQAWQENLSSGKSLYYHDNNSFAINFNNALQLSDPKANFQQLPVLASGHGPKRNHVFALHPMSTVATVSANVKRPEDVVKFMDWLYSPEGILLTNFGIEGEHYEIVDGEPVVLPEIIEQFSGQQDPFRAMQSALGTGWLSFTLTYDMRPQIDISPPDIVNWSELILEELGENYYERVLDPPFTSEELEKLRNLKTKLDDIVTQEMDKFIMGSRPLSEYPAFAKQLRDAGSAQLEDIYNFALKRLYE